MGIYGMPNVGKSTIINQIRANSNLERRQSIAKMSPFACTTKHS